MIKKTKLLLWILLVPLCLSSLSITDDTYQAATSYTNAKEFYDSTALFGENYHSEGYNCKVYYATCAKLASSSSNLRYTTLGFDVTLTGNGSSVSFSVKRTGGSMTEIDSREADGYQYILYSINEDTLYRLATAADADAASKVFDTDKIAVTMNAIMTTLQGDTYGGSIEEDGYGGITVSDTVYRLKNSDDLTAIKEIFTEHTFDSYINIYSSIANNTLSIRYAVDGTAMIHNSSSTSATVSSEYTLTDVTNNDNTIYSVLHYNGAPYTNSVHALQQLTLLSPSDVSLSKEGYHLNPNTEWILSCGSSLSTSLPYAATTIEPDVGYMDKSIYLYANWIPNTYTVKYDKNGGAGYTPASIFTFDQEKSLCVNNFVKKGHSLVPGAEWNTKPDGSGTSYASGEVVSNLTSEDGKEITLYANWQEGIYEVSTNKDGGIGGTDVFYEKYKTSWYSDANTENIIQSISIPSKKGYTFQGYYEYFFGLGNQVTDLSGKIQMEPDTYIRNAVIYASYLPKEFIITFDKQGGTGGSDSAKVIYDELLPIANAPSKNGFTFKGYYTEPNGQGIQYYNEYMASNTLFQVDDHLTLYACWEDPLPPITTINAPTIWSNCADGIKVSASATDAGNGLDRIELYCGTSLVSSKSNLNGTKTEDIDYYHNIEGVYQYKVVGYDLDGNTSESYVTVKYDITAPKGSYTIHNNDDRNYSITVDATDYKIQ